MSDEQANHEEIHDPTHLKDDEGRCLTCAYQHHVQTIGDTAIALVRSMNPDDQRAVDAVLHEHIFVGPLHPSHSDGKFIVRRVDGRELLSDEPVFVFRAHDKLVPQVLERYLDLCEMERCDPEHIDAVHRHLMAIRGWQHEHGTKVPD